MEYQAPTITDFGSIGDHTYQTPGKSTKDTRICEHDKFGENSCTS